MNIEVGRVTKERLYLVRYEDNDREHLTAEELKEFIVSAPNMKAAKAKAKAKGRGKAKDQAMPPAVEVPKTNVEPKAMTPKKAEEAKAPTPKAKAKGRGRKANAEP